MYGCGAGREGNKYETLESEHFPSVSSLTEVAEKAVIEEEGGLSPVFKALRGTLNPQLHYLKLASKGIKG